MLKRLLPVFLAGLALMLVATLWVGARAIDDDLARNANARAIELSGGVAANLNARLLAVDAIVENAAAGDGSAGALLIRQRLLRSPAIRGVVVVSWRAAFGTEQRVPVTLVEADRRVLGSGRALMRNQVVSGSSQSLYLVRALTLGGTAAVLFAEVSPQWLWQGIAPVRGDSAVLVLDNDGLLLQASAQPPPQLMALLTRESSREQDPAEPAARTWRNGDVNWSGAVARLQLDGAQLVGNRWMVVSYSLGNDVSAGFATMRRSLLPLLLLLAAMASLGALYLRMRWQPALDGVLHGLQALADGHYERVTPGRAADAPRLLALQFNEAVSQLQHRMQALDSLKAIDHLLLVNGDLEQSLTDVLARICDITTAHGVTLALLDPNAPGHARAYMAAAGDQEQPVSRIAVDAELLRDLQEQSEGLTVTRCEPGRHSFLEPLCGLGAEFFWVWPVKAESRVAAILSVGYLGLPAVAPEILRFGTECASRLGVALSNSARDEQLYRQAHFDALTSLPNRLLFRDRLAQELASASTGAARGALLYVDLDHFKKVNDTMGHAAGDQLLQIVAQRLKTCIKDGDTVARLGGDEFTIILRSVGTPEAARQIAVRIIESLQQPVNIGGRDHYVRASIGVTMFPDDGNTIEELMRNADLAMYQAKDSGRSREIFYERSMERGQTAAESGLFRALRRREFTLYYQPQYSLADGSLVGLEALLRWQPPREAMRHPSEFIPAAEQSGLIVDIGAWVIETVCTQMAEWLAAGIAPQRVALNVSVQQLRHQDFPKMVRRALDRAGVPPELLELEITESVFADDDARETLKHLAAVGVRLSLDDFGTGYSSLGYLREHPVQAIKIDRSFIEEVAFSVTAATLAETIISMAHALGKQVVAEGVETMEQLEFLRSRQCDIAQGFFLAQPRSSSETRDLLSSRQQFALEPMRAAG
jgi:diguanylate cyclase (GGDEF)-like protein